MMGMAKQCFECGSSKRLNNHHVVPKILGGTKTVPLCSSCHGKVHNRKRMGHSALTKAGQANRREQNKRISRTPYGFDLASDGSSLLPSPVEQKGIRLILRLRRQGYSFPRIAQELDKKGFKTKRSGKWNQATVNGLIRRWGGDDLNMAT